MTEAIITPPVLLLMRHAKSSWSDAQLDDHERPLNSRGRSAARQMAAFLMSNGLQPARILSSSATRALETARIAVTEFGEQPIDIHPELYHALRPTWVALLKTLPCDQTTLILGHNPGMEELVSSIAGKLIPFSTGAIACLKAGPDSSTFNVDELTFRDVWRPREVDSD